MNRPRLISIVVPIFNESTLVERLHMELVRAMVRTTWHWEVIYVNDGSDDETQALLLSLQARDPRITVVELSRNWGHQPALSAGLSVATGDAVVLMDGDLQDPPSAIPDLLDAWANGAQVVVARRIRRNEAGWRRFVFPIFYKVLSVLSDYPIPLNAGIFGLLDRRAADAVRHLSETNRYLPGLRAWIGFRTEIVYYERAARADGDTKQSLWRLLKYAFDAIFSFSYKPLRLSLATGFSLSAFAMLYGVSLVAMRLSGKGVFGIPVVDGYTSTIVAVLFLGGVQLMSVGILGEYIGRIYDEVKRRPLFLIQEVHRREVHQWEVQRADTTSRQRPEEVRDSNEQPSLEFAHVMSVVGPAHK